MPLQPLSNANHNLVTKVSNGRLQKSSTGHLYIGDTVRIITSSLPTFTNGVAQSFTLQATGSTSYSWIASGNLHGLSLSSAGVLSGTPTSTTAGTSITFTVTGGNSQTDSVTLTLVVIANPALVITSPADGATMTAAEYGVAYSFSCAASGGTAPYTWSNMSAFPQGMSINTSGVISGSPSTGQPSALYYVTIDVRDAASHIAKAQVTFPVRTTISSFTSFKSPEVI